MFLTGRIVSVSSLVVDEIKRIIKSSEIIKYAFSALPSPDQRMAPNLVPIEKMTPNGPRKTKMVDKNLKFG